MVSKLHTFPTVTHLEILHLVDRRRLWGKGMSAIDANLVGSVALVKGAQLWSRNKRLKAVCTEIGVPVVDE
jgi:predicted nucleic acid-binding protein